MQGESEPAFPQSRPLQTELKNSCHQDARCQRVGLLVTMRLEQRIDEVDRGQQTKVEHDRHQRRNGKFAQSMKHRRHLRREADKQRVGQHHGSQTQQESRVWILSVPDGADGNRQFPQEHQHDQHDTQQREDRTCQLPGPAICSAFPLACEDRQE